MRNNSALEPYFKNLDFYYRTSELGEEMFTYIEEKIVETKQAIEDKVRQVQVN